MLGALGTALVALALWIGSAPPVLPLVAVGAAVLFLVTLLNADAGLVIIILSMLLSPEIPLGGVGGFGIEGQRSVILRTEDVVLLLVGLAWMARMAIHKDLGAIRRSPLNGWIAAYVAACLLSTLLGIDAGRVRMLQGLAFVLKYVEYFILFFLTLNYVRGEEQLRRLLAVVLITAALITVYAGWQIPSGVRPSAPFEGKEGEPNTLGGYLVLIFCLSAALAQTCVERRWRRGAALLAMATLPPLLATLSRSSWLALAAGAAVLLALAPERRAFAVAMLLAVALLLLIHPKSVEERIDYTLHGEPGAGATHRLQLDPSAEARLSSWGRAIDGWLEHPLLGRGVTGFGFFDAQYFRALVELGALGFAAFAGLLSACGRLFWQALRTLRDPLHRGLALGMVAGFAALLTHAIGTNTFILIRIMEPFWLLTGLVVAALTLEEARA
jgi:O-antigen ligase